MIKITDKSKCCGCNACASVCPQNSITMKRDKEGFLYPSVNHDSCVNCSFCEKVCPEINVMPEQKFEQDGYIVQIKDDVILRESTAGGAFTAIAREILRNNGIVYGVAMDSNFQAHHIYVDNEEDLRRFRNSKYVQSTMGNDTFKEIKNYLNKRRLVCFSGTPCQIEGLKFYLMKEYENLITVDVVCRAVPSPFVFEKYLELQRKSFGEEIEAIIFRDKHYGYKFSTMNIKTCNNDGNYHKGIESDPWLRAFFSNIINRPSCYNCSFKKRYRVSDFTIWDCFDANKFSNEMDNDKGITRLLVHTDKGRKIFSQISAHIKYMRFSPEKIIAGTKEMFESVELHPKRVEFFADANNMDAESLFKKYFPNSIKMKAERFARIALYKLGIYAVAKRLYQKLIK